MTKPTAMWTDAAAVLTVVVIGAFAAHSAAYAVAIGVSGAVAIGNLVVMHWLTGKLVRAIANDRPSAPIVGLMLLKLLAVLGIMGGLMQFFPGEAVALGVASMLMALSIRPMLTALVEDDEPVAIGDET